MSSDQEINWSFINKIITRKDSIVRSNSYNKQAKLDPLSNVKKKFEYYYSLRSNIVHRGKEVLKTKKELD